jgi:hypothetical protein
MNWKTLLAYITGTVDQELLLRNEYLVTENRILRHQIKGRVRLSDGERTTLADISHKLGKQALEQVATLVTPDTIFALFFVHLDSRKVSVAGITPHPHERWMMQMALNMTMEAWGFLAPGQYLIHDRDGKYCPTFQQIIDAAGIKRIPLPARSPNLASQEQRGVFLR